MNAVPLPGSVLVTGGTGFIGGHLIAALSARGVAVTVLSRSPREQHAGVTYIQSLDDFQAPEGRSAVVNLAGEPLNSGRWNASRKALFRDSRVNMTRDVVAWCNAQRYTPETLVSGSAIGWYGHRGDEILTEVSAGASGYSHQLCSDWEDAARAGLADNTRLCLLRTGVVLGADGGPLPEMLGPAKAGLGGPLGGGAQWWSWIHVTDLVSMMLWLLENPSCSGVFNGTAPNPLRQGEFARVLGKVLQRPAFIPLPAPVARLMLGEFAEEILLKGQRVEPARVLAHGFQFEFPSLAPALTDLLG
ncbi:TIGR01777 family protein [Pseudohalioglobus lutimaris]|uniref:TIGR01777 family protein n=2 Tax=Pseudohalioglobus lutimaris TaxID=1737061 RepID=A0A2N5X7M7_9GAMM|nr:TIGR01777 family protein [Pseudohalioglobus lutimaris]